MCAVPYNFDTAVSSFCRVLSKLSLLIQNIYLFKIRQKMCKKLRANAEFFAFAYVYMRENLMYSYFHSGLWRTNNSPAFFGSAIIPLIIFSIRMPCDPLIKTISPG